MDAVTLYFQLRQLVASAPRFDQPDMITPDDRLWLGRAAALIPLALPQIDSVQFNVACDGLGSGGAIMHEMHVSSIMGILNRALAKAELAAPAAAQGQFVGAGDAFSALAAVAKVFGRAKKSLLVVDNYADATLLTDFAVNAPEGVVFQVLCGEGEARRAVLAPALARWRQQFGGARPIELRLAPARQLHDRMIVIDGAECWASGQSFNAMAVRSPTYLSKLDPELTEQKIAAYGAIWDAANAI